MILIMRDCDFLKSCFSRLVFCLVFSIVFFFNEWLFYYDFHRFEAELS